MVSTPICAGDVAVTVTPGSAPPLSSTICPLMLPVELAPPPWANAGPAAPNNSTAAKTAKLHLFIVSPPGVWCSDVRECAGALSKRDAAYSTPGQHVSQEEFGRKSQGIGCPACDLAWPFLQRSGFDPILPWSVRIRAFWDVPIFPQREASDRAR